MKYTVSDLANLVSLLKNTAKRWRKIALNLGLNRGEIAVIQESHQGDALRSLGEVIFIWLTSGEETTSEKLALALSRVGENKLAQEVNPSERYEAKQPTRVSYLNICLVHVVVCVLASIIYLRIHDNTGHSSSLPIDTDELIGRSKEVQEIKEYINSNEVQVLNLYGLIGIGKSRIARHIGHAMLKEGTDVHYINSVNFCGSDALKQVLMEISNSSGEKTLTEWARNLKRRTLLILDNVDGMCWAQEKMRHDLRSFINVLQMNSQKIKILVTSRKKLVILDNYRSYKLEPLDVENCSKLLQAKTIKGNIDMLNAHKICELVGGILWITKIISSALLPPDEYWVEYVIQRLESRLKLQFITTLESRVSKGRVVPALEILFQSISKACFLSCFLLVKDKQAFDRTNTIAAITESVIQQAIDADFHIEECFHELSTSSLLEVRSPYGSTTYEFNPIVRSYLEDRVNNKTLLYMFWKQYLRWSGQRKFFFPYYGFTQEDVEILTDLIKNSEFSNIVAFHVLHNKSFICEECQYKKLQANAIKMLHCPNPKPLQNMNAYTITQYSFYFFRCKESTNSHTPDYFAEGSLSLHQVICEFINESDITCIDTVSYAEAIKASSSSSRRFYCKIEFSFEIEFS